MSQRATIRFCACAERWLPPPAPDVLLDHLRLTHSSKSASVASPSSEPAAVSSLSFGAGFPDAQLPAKAEEETSGGQHPTRDAGALHSGTEGSLRVTPGTTPRGRERSERECSPRGEERGDTAECNTPPTGTAREGEREGEEDGEPADAECRRRAAQQLESDLDIIRTFQNRAAEMQADKERKDQLLWSAERKRRFKVERAAEEEEHARVMFGE